MFNIKDSKTSMTGSFIGGIVGLGIGMSISKSAVVSAGTMLAGGIAGMYIGDKAKSLNIGKSSYFSPKSGLSTGSKGFGFSR